MQKIEEKRHITENTWIALSNDTISFGDYMKVLEHTCDCTWCAERLASVMDEGEHTKEPPAYLKEQILERAGQLDIQLQMSAKRAGRKLSNRTQLLMYSLRVGLAVAVSVFLLVISANIQEFGLAEAESSWEQDFGREAEEQSLKQTGEEQGVDSLLAQMNQLSSNVTSYMNVFSNFILNGGK